MEVISLTARAFGLGRQQDCWGRVGGAALSPTPAPSTPQALLHPQVERSVLPLQQPSVLQTAHSDPSAAGGKRAQPRGGSCWVLGALRSQGRAGLAGDTV